MSDGRFESELGTVSTAGVGGCDNDFPEAFGRLSVSGDSEGDIIDAFRFEADESNRGGLIPEEVPANRSPGSVSLSAC